MSTADITAPPARRTGIEWPTLALNLATWIAFGLVTWYWRDLGWWIVSPLGAFLVALNGSLNHEAVHGHPTRSVLVNEALVFLPISLWYPYRRYVAHHLKHHTEADLTDPAQDPESRYFDPQAWARTPAALRWLFTLNNTMLGRFVLGPAIGTVRFVRDELKLVVAGDRDVATAWALHLAGCVGVWLWVSAICGMPFWQYVFFIAYWGNALTLMRSFAEHRAHDQTSCRTVIVETNPLVSLMFLNNNLHSAHHERPGLAWYRLPAYYRANRARLIEGNCGYLIGGYGEIARRWGLVPKEPLPHPLPHTCAPRRPH